MKATDQQKFEAWFRDNVSPFGPNYRNPRDNKFYECYEAAIDRNKRKPKVEPEPAPAEPDYSENDTDYSEVDG